MDLILASTSPYRERLLARLGLPFRCEPPHTDEAPQAGERPEDLARRLALAKARDVARHNPGAWVIGSDQVATLNDTIVGKPGNRENAIAQLRASSGECLSFFTGVALLGGPDYREWFHVEHFSVYFQTLSDVEIESYVDREQPFDCAGSFRWEALGIVLFEKLCGQDPTSLEGLPLIALTRLLKNVGLDPLKAHSFN